MNFLDTSRNLGFLRLTHLLSYKTYVREFGHSWGRTIIPCIILLMFCLPVGINPDQSELTTIGFTNTPLQNRYVTTDGQQAYSSSGAAQPVTFDGLLSNDSQGLVLVDPSATSAVSIQAPSGWTGQRR